MISLVLGLIIIIAIVTFINLHTGTQEMATKKPTTKKTKTTGEPVVTVGSHSVHTRYPDGRVDFVVDDEKLRADVMEALALATQKPKKAK